MTVSCNTCVWLNNLSFRFMLVVTLVSCFLWFAGEEVGASVASVTENFQQLSVEKDDAGFPSEENAPLVVIPDHLQVEAADCSHLSFGSFGCSTKASYPSGGLASVPIKSNLDEGHNEADTALAADADTRYEYL